MPVLMTKKQAAEYLGISISTLDRLVITGELQAYRIGGSKRGPWRISQEALAEYLNKHIMTTKTNL